MKPIVRNVLAVLAGVVLGSVVNMAIVTSGPLIVPAPAGVDVSDPASLRDSMHLFGPQHFAMPFLAHALGSLVGALVAFLLAATHRRAFAYGIGAFFLLGGIAASLMIPAPLWFIVLDLVVAYLPMAWLASVIGQRLSAGRVAPSSA
ncbi:MAG: hypothetical protein AAGN46_11595 [Acidobacteriota bacterium]